VAQRVDRALPADVAQPRDQDQGLLVGQALPQGRALPQGQAREVDVAQPGAQAAMFFARIVMPPTSPVSLENS